MGRNTKQMTNYHIMCYNLTFEALSSLLIYVLAWCFFQHYTNIKKFYFLIIPFDNSSPCPSLNSLSIAPPGINVLENESIALDVCNSYSTFHPPNINPSKNLFMSAATPSLPPSPPPQPFKPSFTPIVQPRELPRQRLPESFNLVDPLPTAFSLRSYSTMSLYRARMDNRNVVLRVLKGRKL